MFGPAAVCCLTSLPQRLPHPPPLIAYPALSARTAASFAAGYAAAIRLSIPGQGLPTTNGNAGSKRGNPHLSTNLLRLCGTKANDILQQIYPFACQLNWDTTSGRFSRTLPKYLKLKGRKCDT